jgi:hypothetical protein
MEHNIINYIREKCHESYKYALGLERYPTWKREGKELSNVDFLYTGIVRCLSSVKSGRDFLQMLSTSYNSEIPHSTYFNALKSKNKSAMSYAVSNAFYALLCSELKKNGIDYISEFSELNDFNVEAADGHFIEHACHTKKSLTGKVYSAGFVYALNLRNGFLRPVCKVTNGTNKTHEIPYFKKWVEESNIGKDHKNQLYVYDMGCIDYKWWEQQRKRNIFMISMLKENAVTEFIKNIDFDSADIVNTGIENYELHKKGKAFISIIKYRDPETKKLYTFLTTLPSTFRPGLIALLYYKRWTIEKTFNNSKSDLNEVKAWSSNSNSLKNQMSITAMTYNILRFIEEKVKNENKKVLCQAEKKYIKELEKRDIKAKQNGGFVNPNLFMTRISRISAFTIRCIKYSILRNNSLTFVYKAIRDKLISQSIRV